MTWSAESADGFRFVSDPSPTTSAFAKHGRERNGMFFDDDGDSGMGAAERPMIRRGGPSVLRQRAPMNSSA
jgi:hypothetical protein